MTSVERQAEIISEAAHAIRCATGTESDLWLPVQPLMSDYRLLQARENIAAALAELNKAIEARGSEKRVAA